MYEITTEVHRGLAQSTQLLFSLFSVPFVDSSVSLVVKNLLPRKHRLSLFDKGRYAFLIIGGGAGD